MKRVPKSFQAVIITILLGMFIPKIVEITGVAFIDKIMVKGLLSLSFSIATICVGGLFSAHILRDKVSGGKTRILLYLIIAIILLSIASTIVSFIQSISNVILYVLIGITSVLIAAIILYLIIKAVTAKKEFKTTQEKCIIDGQKNNYELKMQGQKISATVLSLREENGSNIVKSPEEKGLSAKLELKSLYELWDERDLSQKCLTATNDENPDLKWVKVYKPPYANGKFYGYVLMNNARNTVNGEIYYADKKIWRQL